MSRLIVLLAFAAAAATAFAQEPADTIMGKELKEVEVEGRTQRVVKFGTEYVPDKKVKKIALNGTNLLMRMQIPQLRVTPGSSTVKTITGGAVAMFIDYVSATEQDIKELRTEDVIRIEVLDYPDDPRFKGAEHVVNFIMQQYEWGGYTKLSASGGALAYDQANGSVYSKFVTGKWTFDVNGSGSWTRVTRDHTESTATFRDFDYQGRHYDEIVRTSTGGIDFKNSDNSQWASMRARYQTQNCVIQHSVSFGRNASPQNHSGSEVTFSNGIIADGNAWSDSRSQSIYPSVNGDYYFAMPRGNTIFASWSFSYGATKLYSDYTLGEQAPIVNDNREKVYSPSVNVSYSKQLGHGNTFRTALMSYNTAYDTRYAGSYSGRQKLLSSENMLFLEYMQSWKCGLNLYSRVGASYVIGRVNGVNTLEQWNPRLGFQLSYRFSGMHSANIEGWWGNSHPSASTSNSAIVQRNELLWVQGNPDLKNTLFTKLKAAYTFIPTNKFSMTAAVSYEGNPDKQALEFRMLPGYDGLVSRSVNSGSANVYDAIVSGSLRLLNNSLIFSANGTAERVVLTGIDAQSLNQLTGSVNGQYYFGNFALTLYYQSPGKQLGPWTEGAIIRSSSRYGLNLNYSYSDFKAELGFYNWFRKDSYSTVSFDSPHYSTREREWMSQGSRQLTLNLVYTIPYGKKVNHNNELTQGGAIDSAILR